MYERVPDEMGAGPQWPLGSTHINFLYLFACVVQTNLELLVL